MAPLTRRRLRVPPLAAFLVAAALAPVGHAAPPAGPVGPPPLPPLPHVVGGEAIAAAARALEDPDLVANLARARRDARRRANLRPVTWTADHAWRIGWDGTTGFDASLSLQVPIADPAAARDADDAAAFFERARLDASLHARSAAEELVQARIALWSARRIADRLAEARSFLPHLPRAEVERLAPLLDHEATARFEEARLVRAIDRATGGRVPTRLSDGVWTPLVDGTERSCLAGEPNVIRAHADLDSARVRDEGRRAAVRPTIEAGVSADVRQAAVAVGPVEFGGSVWLRIGLPRSWSVDGAFRTEVDAHGTRARLSLSGPDVHGDASSSDVAGARHALQRALFAAQDEDAYRRHELARIRARLGELRASTASGDPVGAVERDLDIVTLLARRASLRATLAFACVATS